MIARRVARLFCFCGLAIACSHATTFSKCDVNQDGVTTVADVQKEINQALGVAAAANDLNGSGSVDVVDVQIVIDAVLLPYCAADGTSTTVTGFSPKNGPAGTLVSVAGSNFGAAPQILMSQLGGGSINPPVSTSSAASLSFVVPAGAATGPISVMTSGGSATTSSPFTVTPSTAFTITAAPASATVIQGQSAAYAVSLASTNGFKQLAQLSLTGLPAGITAAFKPPAISAGQTSVLTLTAPNGQPIAASNLSISASATIDGLAVTESASVSLAVAAPTTSLVGRTVVADATETPLAGVTITTLGKDGNGNTTTCINFTTVSDAAGNFALSNLPLACTGPQLVGFNGTTATSPAGKYAGVNLVFTLASGQVTASAVLVHLPRIDNVETFMVTQNSASDQSHSFASIPGLSVTVYAGTTFTMPDNTQPNQFPLAAVQVPVDRLPDNKPNVPTMLRVFIVAFQPANATTNQPVAVYFPNVLNTPPGTDMALMTLDPTHGTMVPYGTGAVSADATQIVPDADPAHPGHRYGLVHFDWHGPMPPPGYRNAPAGDGPCKKKNIVQPAGSGPTCGHPIDIGSGLDVMSTVDITLPSNRGNLEFSRVIRANSVAGEIASDSGPFGFRGSHNYNLSLDTGEANTAASINLVMPDGAYVPFSRQADGTLINTGNPWVLGAILTTNPDDSAALRFRDGVTYDFVRLTPPTEVDITVLSSIVDPNGNTITITRNPGDANQITAITDAVGRQLIFTYNAADLITSITDPMGRTVYYTYTGAPSGPGGFLETFTDQNGGVWQYAYNDVTGNLLTLTDPRGVLVEQNTYDANYRVVSQLQADGSTIQLSYSLVNPLVPSAPVISTVVTDQLGRQSTYRFNPQGFLAQFTDPLGQTRVFTRAQGTNLLLSMTGPGVCDVCGDPTEGDTFFTYDSLGNVLTNTDSLGNVYTSTYDPTFSRVTSLTDPTGAVSTYQYDGNGNLTAVTDPRGNQTTVMYGGFGLPSSITDAAHQTTTFQYDSSANLTSYQDPLGNTTMIAYDLVSRLTQVTDPTGAQASLTWDPLDRPVQYNDAGGGSTYYQYDPVSNLLNLTDPRGFQTVFLYDSLSRLTNRIDPLGRGEIYAYDAIGNLTAHTDRRGQLGHFTYDALDRLVSETYPDATVTGSYDANSRLQQVNDSQGGVFSYQYDAAGRLLHSAAPQGAITYTRDPLGRAVSRQAAGQSQLTYQYDPAGNLTQAAMPQASLSIAYDVRNEPVTRTRSNGVSTAYTYDALARVLSIAHRAGSNSLASFAYTYDAAGNPSPAAANPAQPLTTQATTGTFDAANEMNSFGGRTFTYDANGNRLTDAGPAGTTTYVWDGRNRLQSISQQNGTMTRFTYDFSSNMTQQSATASGATTTTGYLRDDLTNVVAIYGGAAGTLALLTGQNIDDHFATINSAGQPEFALTDVLGSLVAITGASEGLDGKDEYEPFGQTTASGAGFPFAFTGREPVADNIYYYRNRFYDPSVGRFLSEDPVIPLAGSMSLYAYAADAPLSFIDPLGTDFVPVHVAVAFGAEPDDLWFAPKKPQKDLCLTKVEKGVRTLNDKQLEQLKKDIAAEQTKREELSKLQKQLAAEQAQMKATQAQMQKVAAGGGLGH